MAKIIAVTGNAGKTVLSLSLAQQLTGSGKKVVIVATDSISPNMQLILPKQKANRSLGWVLAEPVLEKEDVLKSIVTLKGFSNVGVLSYSVGETYKNYPEITDDNIQKLIDILEDLVDVIIFDTAIEDSKLSIAAKSIAEIKLEICSADLKGLAYRYAHPEGNGYIKILLELSKNNATADIIYTYDNNVNLVIPYCKEIDRLWNGMEWSDFSISKKYEAAINKIFNAIGEISK